MMLEAFFNDILVIFTSGGREARKSLELKSDYFSERFAANPELMDNAKRVGSIVSSSRNPMNSALFGGRSKARWYHRTKSLIAVSEGKCVGITFQGGARALASMRALDACRGSDACILDASGHQIQFHYFEADSLTSQVIMEMDIEGLEGHLDRVGTLWELIFPKEHTIICRTISYTIPKDFRSILFSTVSRTEFLLEKIFGWFGADTSIEKKALKRLGSAFSSKPKFLEAFRSRSPLQSLYQNNKILKGRDVLFPSFEKRFKSGGLSTFEATATVPRCLKFSEDPNVSAASRGDRVHAYVEGEEEFFRDFVVSNEEETTYNDAEHAEQVISHIMAFRRSGLFRNDFAKKIYNVTLPSIILKNQRKKGQDLMVIPHLILYRTPIFSSFRRTFSISYVCTPICIETDSSSATSAIESRKIYWDEAHKINSALRKPHNLNSTSENTQDGFTVTSSFEETLSLPKTVDGLRDIVGSVSIGVLEWINKSGSGRLFSSKTSQGSERIVETAFLASLESQFSTILSLVEWRSKSVEARPWEAWLKSNDDDSIRDSVYKRLFYSDFVDPSSAYTTKESVKLEKMLVGNRLRTDMNGMTFLDPSNDAKLVLYPAEREDFPNYSILRWLGFSIYQDSAIACLQEMIREFNREIDQADDTLAVLNGLEGMLQSFGELYDLDIRYSLYRDEYENVRTLTNLDRDFQRLHERFNSVKEEAILREQRLFNKLLLSLAVVTILFGIIQYAGGRLDWSSQTFAFASSIPLLVVAAIIFRLFDPIRVFLKGSRGDG